jgi:hypothetical protein
MQNGNHKGYPLRIGADIYYLKPPDTSGTREIEDHIKRRRRSPLDIVKTKLDGLSPEMQERLLLAALDREPVFEDFISDRELQEFCDTREGIALMFWLTARENHPTLKLDDFEKIAKSMSDQQFRRALLERDYWTLLAVSDKDQQILSRELAAMSDDQLEEWLKEHEPELV